MVLATSTLDAIRAKARAIAQVPSEAQLVTTPPTSVYVPSLDGYINDYYQNDFPEELRLLKLKGTYTFYTTPNQDTYDFPQDFVTCETPCYVSGFPAQFFQEKTPFYNYWPQVLFNQQVGEGDGTTGPFSFTFNNLPILQGTVIIADLDGQETFTDTATPGILVGTQGGSGTIDYLTGACTWSYANALPAGVTITGQTWPYRPSRPLSILWFNNAQESYFVLRPVPDQVYKVEIQAYRQPTQLLAGSDVPELNEWWKTLAIGAATKILEDRMDIEQLSYANKLLADQLSLINRRTLVQLMNQSAPTIYNNPPGPYNTTNIFPYGV